MADTHRRPPLPLTTTTFSSSSTTTTNDDLRGLSQQDIASLRNYLSSTVTVPNTQTQTQHRMPPHTHNSNSNSNHNHHNHNHNHNTHHHPPTIPSNPTPSTAAAGGGGTANATSDDVHLRLYPLKCGALTIASSSLPAAHNDSDDSDSQPYPLPWYANRRAKQLSQKRSRAAAPSSNGCGAIIHNASSRSERAWIARGYPTEAVVPLAPEFFNHPDAKDGRMPCGCEWHGVGCRHCGAPLGEVFYPCPKHNRHGDSLPMFTFDMTYVTALGAPTEDPSTPPSPLSPSSHSSHSSIRTLRIDHPPSPRISTRHPPIVVNATPNNPYVPTGAYPPTLPTVAGARPVIMARPHHPTQRPPPLPHPHRSPSCPGSPHDSEEDSGSEEETTGGSGSGSGSYSDESLPISSGGNPTPTPPRSNSQSSLQSC